MSTQSRPPLDVTVGRQGLTERVYDAIVDLLLEGELPEDSPVRIEKLAARLGVSATPVREALVRLEATGLVVRSSFKGYRTAKRLEQSAMRDLMMVRRLLEPQATFLACADHRDLVLPQLEAALAEQEAARRAGGPDEFRRFMRADQQFHRIIHDGCGNRFLATAADTVGGNVQRWRQFENRVISDADESLEEHRTVLAAFRSGDPDAARVAMSEHLDNLSHRMQLHD